MVISPHDDNPTGCDWPFEGAREPLSMLRPDAAHDVGTAPSASAVLLAAPVTVSEGGDGNLPNRK